MPHTRQSLLIVASLSAATNIALAQNELHEDAKLTATDAAPYDLFGHSVSVSGDVVVVGAYKGDCGAGIDCGSVYVYRFNGSTYVQEQKLTASDAAADDRFGYSVSVSGDVAIVGAFRDDCEAGEVCGSAYVYRFKGSAWVHQAKLIASDGAAVDYFGFSVSVSGNVAVVGAFGDDCLVGVDCGSAYVFRFNGSIWVEEQKLTASDAVQLNLFGSSVSVSGDTAIVGVPNDNCGPGMECGSAYVYSFNGSSWIQQAKLAASDAASYARFGDSVSESGDVAIVGAPGAKCGAGDTCGSAYVFVKPVNGWTDMTESSKLAASDAEQGDAFGVCVSVCENVAVVGSYGDDCGAGINCGSAYVYRFNGNAWVQRAKLTASDGAAVDFFGHSVSVNGDTTVVGADLTDCGAGSDCGSGYIYFSDSNTDECEPAACCEPDGSCSITVEAACGAGTWTQGGSCVPNLCPVIGSCCLANGSCILGAEPDCDSSGLWIQGGSCTPDLCIPAPSVVALGSRYVQITPSGFTGAVALQVTSPDEPCLSRYVAFDSGRPTLIDNPVFLTPRAWGTVALSDSEVIPGTTYYVQATDGSDQSAYGSATTWEWGDVDHTGLVDVDDILCILDAFMGFFGGCALEAVDLAGCEPNGLVDVDDILAVLSGFSGDPYPCPEPCP